MDTILKLKEIQEIDSRLDAIIELRGDLPKKIEELEEEIQVVAEKHGKFDVGFKDIKAEIHTLEEEINHNKVELEHDEENFKSVTNNKEYDALTLQISARKDKISQNEIKIEELADKRDKIEIHLNKFADELKELTDKKDILQSELGEKITETEKEEKSLLKVRKKIENELDEVIRFQYNNIRTSKKLAVSMMIKKSCNGCRSVIPLQQQAEIKNRKKVTTCEACGRIIIDDFSIKEEDETK